MSKPKERILPEKPSFRVESLGEWERDFLEEVYLSMKEPDMTKAINRILMLARANQESSTKAEGPGEEIMVPPNCGNIEIHPIHGPICILKVPRPVRKALLGLRKLPYFDCQLCDALRLKQQYETLLAQKNKLEIRVKGKHTPELIALGKEIDKIYSSMLEANIGDSPYHVIRDLPNLAKQYETLDPTELAEVVWRVKLRKITPEAIAMWLKRHPDIEQDIFDYISRKKEEKARALHLV